MKGCVHLLKASPRCISYFKWRLSSHPHELKAARHVDSSLQKFFWSSFVSVILLWVLHSLPPSSYGRRFFHLFWRKKAAKKVNFGSTELPLQLFTCYLFGTSMQVADPIYESLNLRSKMLQYFETCFNKNL